MKKKGENEPLLVEVAWEVCNQLGGIYTVIRSKAPTMMDVWGENYCLIGPYTHSRMPAEFEATDNYDDPIGQTVLKMREWGFDLHYGYWLVSGTPKVVLINPFTVFHKLHEIKFNLWENHGINMSTHEDMIDQVAAFGHILKIFLGELVHSKRRIIAHFHEWMVGTALPDIKREQLDIATVFTTHATQLGRYLAMNDPHFYDNIHHVNWHQEAINYNVESKVLIERSAAHCATVLTTVSDVTAVECAILLGRKPDVVTPNGINVERFMALHEFQNLHREYKEKIHQFVMGHFFQSYSFDLDKTLYFFTSGRFEYHNKGFDLTLEALARLNYRMKQANIDKTVVMIFVTKQPYHSINPGALQSRAVMEEIRTTCKAIEKQLGERIFYAAASNPENKFPDLNTFVDDYLELRLRRTIQSWRSDALPSVVTHNLVHDSHDQILNFLRSSSMLNHKEDRVKVVYHPDFISPTNPLFGMEYGQFVRGCHLGVFPSFYEPWGYTPLESIASGVPAVTSDLAGFGDYVMQNIQDREERGIYVVDRRRKSFDDAANQLADMLFSFVQLNRRERIKQRNRVESSSEFFDWKNLVVYYDKAYKMALKRQKGK